MRVRSGSGKWAGAHLPVRAPRWTPRQLTRLAGLAIPAAAAGMAAGFAAALIAGTAHADPADEPMLTPLTGATRVVDSLTDSVADPALPLDPIASAGQTPLAELPEALIPAASDALGTAGRTAEPLPGRAGTALTDLVPAPASLPRPTTPAVPPVNPPDPAVPGLAAGGIPAPGTAAGTSQVGTAAEGTAAVGTAFAGRSAVGSSVDGPTRTRFSSVRPRVAGDNGKDAGLDTFVDQPAGGWRGPPTGPPGRSPGERLGSAGPGTNATGAESRAQLDTFGLTTRASIRTNQFTVTFGVVPARLFSRSVGPDPPAG